MNIKLDSTYSLSADALQWVLLKEGRAYWFFTNLEDLLNDYLQLKLRGSDAKLISSLIDNLNKKQQRLNTLLTSSEFKAKLPILSDGGKK